jgi:hypothetical protein
MRYQYFSESRRLRPSSLLALLFAVGTTVGSADFAPNMTALVAVGALLARKVSRNTNDAKQRARLREVPKRPLGLKLVGGVGAGVERAA